MLRDLFYACVGLAYNINQKILKAVEDGKNILKEKNVGEYISSEVTKKKDDIDKLREELKNFKNE
ncbi:MAG TPA: hypothetical protein ENM99_01505 [Desulfurella acetivorans]|uniref:Uncharacterized protein n=1 Tax=Desulfurella acetivorans TaxID=33002 RepID=A0A7C6E7R3_DESAE|nr:hypothetical protein [Desulfurella acetivorans]